MYAAWMYVSVDASFVVIMLGDGALPVVMSIVRGAFGRHAWTMQLRHQNRSRKVIFSQSAAGSISDIYTCSLLLHCITSCLTSCQDIIITLLATELLI